MSDLGAAVEFMIWGYILLMGIVIGSLGIGIGYLIWG